MPRFNESQWEAEEDVRTLKRADEIRQDDSRLKRAKGIVNKEMEALKNLSTLSNKDFKNLKIQLGAQT